MTPWSFIHASDMHVGTPRSYRFQPAWNDHWETARRQIIALQPDLLLVGGDMTRDGSTHRFELAQFRKSVEDLPFPVHLVPGNHEVGNKCAPDSAVAICPDFLRLYASVFGPSEWSFVYKEVRFSGCNAFLLGTGLAEEARLRKWLEVQQQQEPARHHVWVLHPALFADHPDEANFHPDRDRVAWYFTLDRRHRHYLFEVFRATGATDVITAHIHCRRHVTVDGLRIHFAPSTAFPQWKRRWPDGDARLGFLRFTVSGSGLDCRFVPLELTSDRKGYGPGGNPPLEGRDYSVAWEHPPLDPAEDRLPAREPD